MSMEWFRHSNDMSTDAKLSFIAKKAGARRCEMTAFWDCLLEHASGHAERGFVGDIDLEMVADTQEIDLVTIKALHALLCNKGVVTSDGRLKQWERYNDVTKKPAMTSAERVRKYREKQNKIAESDQGSLGLDVTKCNESNDVTTHYTTAHNIKNKKLRKEELGGYATHPVDKLNGTKKYFKNDFGLAAAACCSMLRRRNLSPTDNAILMRWCEHYDFERFIKPILVHKTEMVITKTGKPPGSLSYFSAAIAEKKQ